MCDLSVLVIFGDGFHDFEFWNCFIFVFVTFLFSVVDLDNEIFNNNKRINAKYTDNNR